MKKIKNCNNIVVDFDGTLVLENSSRLFESATLTYHTGLKRAFVKFIFFSSFSKILDRIFSFMSTLLGVDSRLYVYSHISQKVIICNVDKIIGTVVSNLTLNVELYDSLKEDDVSITILSRGIDVIIEKFLKLNNVEYSDIISSNMDIDDDDDINLRLLSFKRKVSYLENLCNFVYYTDGLIESRYICKKLKIDNVTIDHKLFVMKRYDTGSSALQ